MTEEAQIGTGMTDVVVETNFTPAPVEQKSPEPIPEPSKQLATTEPTTSLEDAPVDSVAEVVKPEPITPSAEDKANEVARKAIEDRIRADDAERRLRELQPKTKIPEIKPDINDKATWGDKYKDAPNDLDTFLQARDEWAQAQGEKKAQDAFNAAEQQRQNQAIKVEVERKQQESRVKHADYDAVINPIVPIIASIPILKDFIGKNPMGTEVAYELAKNPAILEQLMRGDAWTAGEQLINMAARLKAPKPVQITNAPEPIKPVGSRETVKPNVAELATKDINGYMKTMNKRELAKKRA